MSLLNKVKQTIPTPVKSRVQHALSPRRDVSLESFRGKPKAIIALAADYANLGDVAITLAQANFLKSCLPAHEIVFFPAAATFVKMKALKAVCSPEDIITIVGGGNMGDLYDSLEDCRRFVVEQFPDNKVISFPQTIDFSETTKGDRELEKSSKAYRRHKNFHLFARERTSYERMQAAFPDLPLQLTPDIVLSAVKAEPARQRRGTLLCLRDDAEAAISGETRSKVIEGITGSLDEVTITDTVNPNKQRLPITERFEQLETLLDEFRGAEVVVTDRLHGMIFSAITATPCVVLPNNNHKIKASYHDWLRALPFLRLLDSFDPDLIVFNARDIRGSGTLVSAEDELVSGFKPLRRCVTGE